MADVQIKPRRGFTVVTGIKLMLFAQLGIAVFLAAGDLFSLRFNFQMPTQTPTLERPIAPGDQTRRYRPEQAPVTPYTGPDIGPMAERLQFEKFGETLKLNGQIAPGDAKRFVDYIDGLPSKPKMIELFSPGGSVQDALEIGRRIRADEMNTKIVSGAVCLSACPYLLAAGVDRTVDAEGFVGVHQHYFGQNTVLPAFMAVEDIQRGQGEVMGYLEEMGIDPLIMQPALLTPPDEIYILTPEELVQFNVVGA
ncbi:hypothetical protein [Parasulfitobacter algicola]|uniref:Periplasmic protein-like protein n=1 Tax=Parasulfitobacter algicola TaxID=2614809 RepID=A0ABX2IRI3_9RHOB|nr:hypothetical protein [Sulfitobacter algicola]NSX54626.1 hypothetical protein [Sulfitobacter algicola]